MKYAIPSKKMYELISKYLDMTLKDLIKKQGVSMNYYFANPNGRIYFGLWTEKHNGEGLIVIDIKFLNQVGSVFSLKGNDAKELVGAYIVNNYFPKYKTNFDIDLAHLI